MPFDSTTGIFTRVSNSFSEPVFGTLIDPVGATALFDDYDNAIDRDAELILTDFWRPSDDVDFAPALQRAGAAVVDGGAIIIPPTTGGFVLNSVDGNNAALSVVNKGFTIKGTGWNFNAGGSTTTPSGSLFKFGPDFPDTADGILLIGTYAVTGMQMADFAITPHDSAFGVGQGRDAIRIDATGQDGFGHDSLNIRRLFIGNMKTGYSFHTLASSANGGGALANSKISDCHFRQGRFENVGDSVTIENAIIGANTTNDVRNLGIYFYNTPGATKFRVSGGNNFAFNGKIVCDGGITPMFDGIELEQAVGFANTRLAMIDLNGGVSQIVGPIIINCQLSQNSVTGTRPTGIRANNTDGGSVTNTYISLVDAVAGHITQTASSLNLYVDHESNDYFTAGVRVTTGMVVNPQPSLNSKPPLLNVLPTGNAYATAATANTIGVRDGSGNLAVVGLTATAQISNTLNSGGPGAGFLANAANAAVALRNPTNAVDEKTWDVLAQAGAGSLQFRAVNDANSVAATWLTAFRGAGATVSGVTLLPPVTVTGGVISSGPLAMQKGSVAVANGLNSNIATPVHSFIRLTGPSAVFSIGGFTGGVDGYSLTVYNTVAFAMTIVNEDASSTAANRIKTLTGGNVTLRAGTSMAVFIWDSTDARWILTATN